MGCDRRSFLKGCAVATATAVAAPSALAADDERALPPEAIGLLYDATRCIGCKACVVACKKANDLAPDTHYVGDGLYDAPDGLNEQTKTVIQLYKGDDATSFVKKQCMHCIDPACVNACMIGALKKEADTGLVWWRGERCVGCRYCQVACPFQVPKFEWTKQAPKIVKCELCKHRLADGGQPACTEVCPRQAVVFGKTRDLLADAHARIESNPGLYNPKVYGETELGGTQCLYLAAREMPFENLGFHHSQEEAVPLTQRSVQHGVYQGFVAPAALYVALAFVMFRNRQSIEPTSQSEKE
ncbi:MAG: hydrogenase 2 operon protein HybA [Acidobacteria bacterium]|nr:hydrogenase 2 operon protein HybA [Acidobacteriota bacterium]